jgi:hypothetical protein
MTQQIPATPIEKSAPLDQALQQVLDGALESPAARQAVRQAGRSGDPGLIPLLEGIAERTSEERYFRLTFEALCSAQLLGLPRKRLLAGARAHTTKKWLAYSSILLLGRDPEDEETAAALAAVKSETTDNQISGAVAEAERVRAVAEELPDTGTAEERAADLLQYCRGEWNPITREDPALGWEPKPVTAWARRKLRELSEESPDAVARALSRMDLSEEYPDEPTAVAYQSFLAGLLSDEARQRLADLI